MPKQKRNQEFSALSDEELIECCADSSDAVSELFHRYIALVRNKSLAMAKNRSDADDLMQEGFLALLKAVRTFRNDGSASFSTYANVCITNKMTTAIIKNNRTDIPIDLAEEQAEESVSDTPESILIEKENQLDINNRVSLMLSKREWQIFRLFLMGSTYDQMARQLNISPKSVDNALQRVRRKLKLVWRADHF